MDSREGGPEKPVLESYEEEGGMGMVKQGDLRTWGGEGKAKEYPFPNIWALTLTAFEVVPLNEGQLVSI